MQSMVFLNYRKFKRLGLTHHIKYIFLFLYCQSKDDRSSASWERLRQLKKEKLNLKEKISQIKN